MHESSFVSFVGLNGAYGEDHVLAPESAVGQLGAVPGIVLNAGDGLRREVIARHARAAAGHGDDRQDKRGANQDLVRPRGHSWPRVSLSGWSTIVIQVLSFIRKAWQPCSWLK